MGIFGVGDGERSGCACGSTGYVKVGQRHCTTIDYQSTRKPHGQRGLYVRFPGARSEASHNYLWRPGHSHSYVSRCRCTPSSVCIGLIAHVLPHKIWGFPLSNGPISEFHTMVMLMASNINDIKATCCSQQVWRISVSCLYIHSFIMLLIVDLTTLLVA